MGCQKAIKTAVRVADKVTTSEVTYEPCVLD